MATDQKGVRKKEASEPLALLALIFSLLFFLPPLPLIGLVLAIIVLVTKRPGRGLAIAAIVINVVYALLILLMVVGVALFLVVAAQGVSHGSVSVNIEGPAAYCEHSGSPDDCYIDVAATRNQVSLCKHVSEPRRDECFRRVHDQMQRAVRIVEQPVSPG